MEHIYSGNIDFESDKIAINTSRKFEGLEEIGEIIVRISTDSGAVTQLRDIAVIKKNEDTDSKRYQYNGNDAILLNLYCKDGINVITEKIQRNIRLL